jgi:hypothetical protein|tara:strand:+ start:922 stop:1122 length:201 start_codon:yes stop_codon:yes gene_type:complete
MRRLNQTVRYQMYIVMIYSDSCDPWAYGTFKSLKTAQKFEKEYKAKWSERDWYQLQAHIIKLDKRS